MPIYEHQCVECGSRLDLYLKLADLDKPQSHSCGGRLERRISAPAVFGDYPGYVSHGTGRWVEGRRAHLEDLKQSNCRVYEPGEREQWVRRKAEREKAFGDAVEQLVEKTAQEVGVT